MKIGIIGAGAMGSIFAYFFARSGIQAVLFEKSRELVIQIGQAVNIIIDGRTEKNSFEVSDNPEILRKCGIIFIFVKTYNTDEALKEIVSSIDNDAIIVSLQNGIGNKEKIAAYFSPERIVYGSTSIGATRMDGNTVRLGGMGNNVIGGSGKKAVNAVGDALRKAGLEVEVADNPGTAVWKKAIINAGINPLGAILGISNGLIIANEYSKKIQEDIVREAVSAARSSGVMFDPDEMIKETGSVCERTAQNLCSMLQDVNAKRRTEIDSINGAIIETGRKYSIALPYNEAVYCLIKAKEAGYLI